MELSPTIMEQLREHAELEYPRECCGIVFSSGRVHRCINIAIESHRFEPSAADQVRLAESFDGSDPAVVLYHSHPDAPARPSARDNTGLRWNDSEIYPQLSTCIIEVHHGRACSIHCE